MFAITPGCDDDGAKSQDSMAQEPERGPSSKADGGGGTCNLRYGADYDVYQTCQCDDTCQEIGDCCDDYANWCGDDPVPGDADCDSELLCPQVLTCVENSLYPTGCGPANCDDPLGPCTGADTCDVDLICEQRITCLDGELFPTSCGPANCDPSLGFCATGDECDPELICAQVTSCIEGELWPTPCGPAACDLPLGEC